MVLHTNFFFKVGQNTQQRSLVFTESAENSARSLLVRLVRLGGTAGGGGFLFRLASLDIEPRDTPLGGSAGGSPLGPTPLTSGGTPHCPFILCGRIGEFVASCDAVTDFVFRVPVLLLVMAFVVLDWNQLNKNWLNWLNRLKLFRKGYVCNRKFG